MEAKKHPPRRPTGEEKQKQQFEALKSKLNDLLIRYFGLLVWAVALLILVSGLAFFIYPEYLKIIHDSEAAAKNLQKEVDDKTNYLATVKNLKQSYSLVSAEEKNKIEGLVPASGDTGPIILEIESMAERNGAVLNTLKLSLDDSSNNRGKDKVATAGIYSSLPAGVKAIKIEAGMSSVNYAVLKNIIKTLENNLRLYDIEKIDFSSQESKISLNIYTYYLAK